ncbi:hypothetical protein AKJ48_04195 [candidate division MSBL1 archaeon SCGC-AAA261O19]|uniref:Uncharacterized protein n=1 Tax=candidate division MSBL1 archaeon SCGC-AAA261O19 TaxID=1698277 RepID=A0A133V9L6_9EURY|nr:hypothetical protein AKJ48_04195 [candidate division MSBL1 archaeon SCGC-AAA261O19]
MHSNVSLEGTYLSRRALGIGLALLSIALWVGPIVAAFASNGWNLKETVMPSQDELSRVKDKVGGLTEGGFSENTLQIVDNQMDLTTGEFEATLEFESPFNIDVKITEFSFELYCEQHDFKLVPVQLEENEVSIPASAIVQFDIVGSLTSQGRQHIIDNHGGKLPEPSLENPVFELESYGVTIRMENMELGG